MSHFDIWCVFVRTFALEKEQKRMKVKLTKEQIETILKDPEAVIKAGIKLNDPWWVIVLKVIAYAIGLILAGAATTGCARMVIGI